VSSELLTEDIQSVQTAYTKRFGDQHHN